MSDTQAANGPKAPPRPLSPHLQVYRLPLPAVSSITHRITGVGLTVGTLLMAWWLIAAAAGPAAYAKAAAFIGSPIGWLLMAGWVWALWYHTLNGVRHLMWDAGRGLELAPVYRGGYIVWGASVGLTVATLAVAASMA